MTGARLEVEVLALDEGRAVVRIVGRRAPLLLLDHKAIGELEQLFAAAVLRIRAHGDAAASDAITQFLHTFEALLAEYDVERKRHGADLLERKDHGAALEEFENDLKLLRDGNAPRDDAPS